MAKAWFKVNKQKIGWMPISWQGWVLTISYIIFTVYNYKRIDETSQTLTEIFMDFIPQTIIFTGLYSVLCYLTAEKAASKDMLE